METNKALNFLISSVGRRVELVQLLKKTMNEMKINGTIIGMDIDRTAPALHFCDSYYIVPPCNEQSYIDKIINIGNEHNITVLIPTIDTELPFLAEQREYIENETNMTVMVSEIEIIEIFFNKNKTSEYFQRNDMPAPHVFKNGDVIDKPVIIKPIKGSASEGVRIINDIERFSWDDVDKNEIVQALVSGDEITIDAFYDFNGNLISTGMRKRIRVRGGEVQIAETVYNRDIAKHLMGISENSKFRGGVTFQAFADGKDVNFIECNPRFGGGLPMTIMAGNNFLRYLIELLLYGEIIKTHQSEMNIVFSRYDQSIRIADD